MTFVLLKYYKVNISHRMDDPWELIIDTEQAMFFCLYLPPPLFCQRKFELLFGDLQEKEPAS